MKVYRRGEGEPQFSIVGAIHGDEPAGKEAIERFLEKDIEFRKPVQFIVANEEALEENKRFIEKDVNRAFPGDPESEFREERLAAELLEKVEGTTVLDIHTTQSYPKPFSTIKGTDERTVELLSAANIEEAICFPENSGVFVEFVDGIVVEAGLPGSDETVDNALVTIENFLAYFGAIEGEYETSEPEIYEYIETVDGDWEFLAENFEKVEEGEVYARRDGEELRAEEDFYPVLMSTSGYEGKLGYKARKLGRFPAPT
jgi:succinylglutamate desuccinylase